MSASLSSTERNRWRFNCYIVTGASTTWKCTAFCRGRGHFFFIRQSLKCISLWCICVLALGERRRSWPQPPRVPPSRGRLCLRWPRLHECKCRSPPFPPALAKQEQLLLGKKSSWSLKRQGILCPPSVVQWGAEISGEILFSSCLWYFFYLVIYFIFFDFVNAFVLFHHFRVQVCFECNKVLCCWVCLSGARRRQHNM